MENLLEQIRAAMVAVDRKQWENYIKLINDKLAEESDRIAISWHIDDVKHQDPTISDEDAREVLVRIKDNHDASVGVNWDVIDYWIDQTKEEEE